MRSLLGRIACGGGKVIYVVEDEEPETRVNEPSCEIIGGASFEGEKVIFSSYNTRITKQQAEELGYRVVARLGQ